MMMKVTGISTMVTVIGNKTIFVKSGSIFPDFLIFANFSSILSSVLAFGLGVFYYLYSVAGTGNN